MLNVFETFVKFTTPDGVVGYYSIYQLSKYDPDSFIGDMDEILYKKVGQGLGVYVPI